MSWDLLTEVVQAELAELAQFLPILQWLRGSKACLPHWKLSTKWCVSTWMGDHLETVSKWSDEHCGVTGQCKDS